MRALFARVSLIAFVAFLPLSNAWALSSKAAAECALLKDVNRDFRVSGTICEEVARLRFEAQYPSDQYHVVTGIEYHGNGRTLGELDVVVFRNDDNMAMIVAEVKCWNDKASGLRKAHAQLERFRGAIRGRVVTAMQNTADNEQFDADQFTGDIKFVTISQDDGPDVGYDMTLGYSLQELHEMSETILR